MGIRYPFRLCLLRPLILEAFVGRYLEILRSRELPGSAQGPIPSTPHPRPLRDNPKYLPVKAYWKASGDSPS